MKVYLNKEYKCVKVEDNTFVANDSSNYIRYYFVTNANGDVIDKMDDTSVIYRNTEPSYVTVAFRRADGNVIQHLMASPKTDATGKSFFEYEITDTDGVLYKKGALEISAQFIEATLSEAGGVKKVISQKVKAIAINTAHVLDNIGEEAEEYYSQYEQANNDAHAVLQAQITTNFNNIGTLQELTTDAKDDLVKAINEVDAHADANKSEIGDLSTLTTDEKTTIVGAINEVDAHADANKAEIGTLNALTTDEKATLVGAINEVDNHADNATTLANNAVATANSAVATANEAKTTAQTAENNANSAVDTANAANATADEAKAIAQGSQRAIGFATLQAAITALNGYSNTQLKVGDNVYIVETGVPDLWVAAVEQNSVAYNYTTNDAFNDDLVENTLVQVGYYKFAYLESDGKPCTVAWQNMTVAASDWVASTEFADFPYEAKIILSDFVNFSSIPQVVFGLTEATSGNYAPICKAGDKGVYIYSKVNTAITLPTVVTFAPNVHGASMQGGGYTNKGKWVASTTYAIDDLVYTDNGQFVCIEGITSTTSPEQDTQHWQATFVATGKTKNTLTISGQDNGTGVQKTFDGSTAVEIAFDENTMTAKEVNGVLKVGAKGTIPEALPQEASALKSGELPTSGWTTLDEGWKGSTLPASRGWTRVTYGDGKYVAVASNSSAGAYSTDGITWTEMILPTTRYWMSVTYGNGKFVAVAQNSGKGAYSTDGISWTEMSMPANIGWYSVTYGDGKFVAVAVGGSAGAYSTDGINWSSFTLPRVKNWISVTYGNGKFIALPNSGKNGAYSMDGITWTEMILPAGRTWSSVIYGNGKYVAVATENNAYGAYSTNGINWTEMSMPASRDWYSVTYGNGKFVAVASNSSAGAYSTDGVHWTNITLPASVNWYSVTYGNGKFVALAMSSTNGAYWKATADITYVISDTSITANSDILMELTDDGGVKSYSMEAGKITVIRDTVPTAAIPYTYKVKQTNASGQFTVLNHFVPSIPESPTSLPVSYKKASGELPTSGWTSTVLPLFVSGEITLSQEAANGSVIGRMDAKDATLESGWKVTVTGTVNNTYIQGASSGNPRIDFSKDSDYSSCSLINKYNQRDLNLRFYKGGVITAYADKTGNYNITIYNTANVKKTYTISDTFITENTSVKMRLTDKGGVKAQSKANGSITVVRDEVPPSAIPYEYEVEETSAEGLFEVINAYVPIKTSELTNDSGFITSADIPSAGEWVSVTGEATTLTEAGTYQFVTTADKVQSIMYWDGTTSAVGTPAVALNVNNSSPEVITLTPVVDTAGRLIIHKETLIKENNAWVVKGSAISTGFKYRKIN